jgi:REP element-mobilizing transposase RayT
MKKSRQEYRVEIQARVRMTNHVHLAAFSGKKVVVLK